MASNVVAVPKSSTTSGSPRPRPYASKAAMPLTRRSAPTSDGCAYRFGIPRSIPASTLSGVSPRYRFDISIMGPVSCGTTDASTTPSIVGLRDLPAFEQFADHQPEFVSRPLARGGEAPAPAERRTLEHAEDDVRVPDIDGKQHDVRPTAR